MFYHSCGGITDILEDLIDIGVDILDPLQFNAMQLTPRQLADKCGPRLAFHGGLDTQDLLVHATPDRVRQEIQCLKRELGRHGKYILSGSHFLQPDVPLPNIEAVVAETC